MGTFTTELMDISQMIVDLQEKSDIQTVHGAKVLVVDDEPAIQRAVQRVLKSLGISIDGAANSVEAMEILQGQKYDLIISDLHMRGGDGTELLRNLRKDDQITPVIMLSGSPTIESTLAAVNYNAFQYLTKPFSFDVLRTLASQAILKARSEKTKSKLTTSLRSKEMSDKEQFALALSTLWVAKQPIVNTRRNSVGFEVLLRTEEMALRNPESFWSCAVSLDRGEALSRAIRFRMIELMNYHPHHVFFYNFHFDELTGDYFFNKDNELHTYSKRIILEISDRQEFGECDLEKLTGKLKDIGYRFALDNFGTGGASLDRIFQIRPDYVKLDRELTHDVHRLEANQRLVKRLVEICTDMKIEVIAECVEVQEDFLTLKTMGVEIFQGYLFGRPVG